MASIETKQKVERALKKVALVLLVLGLAFCVLILAFGVIEDGHKVVLNHVVPEDVAWMKRALTVFSFAGLGVMGLGCGLLGALVGTRIEPNPRPRPVGAHQPEVDDLDDSNPPREI